MAAMYDAANPPPEAPPVALPAARKAGAGRILFRVICWAVFLGALIAGGWYAYPFLAASAPVASRRDAMSRPTLVVTAAVRTGDVPVHLDGIGTVTPLQTATVRSRVDGQLMSVVFQEGQLVKAGDLLAEVDPRPFQVQLTQAQGQLARDQALLANARTDLERYRTLLAQESAPQQQIDTQQSLVQQYEGAIEVDQGQVDNAKLQLTYAHITAPISGRTGLRLVDAGNIVHAGDATGIVVITQEQPTSVVFPIPQDRLQAVLTRLRSGAKLPVTALDRQQQTVLAVGELTSVDNQIDAIGMVRLKAQFDNQDGQLFPNQFVNARLLLDTLRAVPLAPAAALQLGANGTYVYVVDGEHKVALRNVQTGPAAAGEVSIAQGLAVGELVVTDGADRLREGVVVQVAQPGPAGDAGASEASKPAGGHRREGRR